MGKADRKMRKIRSFLTGKMYVNKDKKRWGECVVKYGRSPVKGRKVRNLVTGKMYVNKHNASEKVITRKSKALKRSWKKNEGIYLKALGKGIIASQKKFNKKKFIKTMQTAHKLHREKFKRKIKHLKKEDPVQYRYLLSKRFEDSLFPVISQPGFFKKLGYTLKHCRNGKEVVRFIQCERDKSIGVVEYAPESE
jgi:hypothetical protein